ncbi:MAG: subtype B tannase [Spongiibacteraceae bacterium]
MQFDATRFDTRTITINGKTLTVRAYENILYVAKPVDAALQRINIYIPEAYFNGEKIGIYDAQTAPIFLPNQVGGYMPAQPGTLDGRGMPGAGDKPSTIALALARGYVVASPGARGRTSQSSNGDYIGKAPAAIVDLKAAVRYLRFNDARMPGNAEKIISNGTSAGGALSALLGASGNATDYQDELKKIGAADSRDDIFAVSSYCPITNLEHADAAYEWQFNGVHDFKKIDISMLDYKMQRREIAGTLSPDQIELSNALKKQFPDYINSLHLIDNSGKALQLDAQGNGSFKNYVMSLVIASAQVALDQGQDLSRHTWLTIKAGKVRSIDFDGYVHYMGRQKLPPAFDGLDLSTGENQLFGTASRDKQHFTAFSAARSTHSNIADAHTIAMMNPMHYIGMPGVNTAQHWRIRHGTYDKDTGLAISTALALTLQKQHIAVDFAFPWDRPHSGDYDLDELFAWIDNLKAAREQP